MELSDLFVEAIKKGELSQVEQLLKAHPGLLQHKLQGDHSPALMAMDYGARVNARKTDGQTPLALAEQSGHNEVVDFLKARGAEM